MKKRSIAVYIILSIITCGIYFLVVSYMQLAEMERDGASLKFPPIVVLILNLFITPVGGALLGYAADDALKQIRGRMGMPQEDNMVLWLVLGIFLPVITGALIQNSVNKTLDGNV